MQNRESELFLNNTSLYAPVEYKRLEDPRLGSIKNEKATWK